MFSTKFDTSKPTELEVISRIRKGKIPKTNVKTIRGEKNSFSLPSKSVIFNKLLLVIVPNIIVRESHKA